MFVTTDLKFSLTHFNFNLFLFRDRYTAIDRYVLLLEKSSGHFLRVDSLGQSLNRVKANGMDSSVPGNISETLVIRNQNLAHFTDFDRRSQKVPTESVLLQLSLYLFFLSAFS